jgi:hypothetical protein
MSREIVGAAALTELFKLDRGFQKWKDRSQKPDASSDKVQLAGQPSLEASRAAREQRDLIGSTFFDGLMC